MLPKVLAGCLIGAFVTLLLPRETDRALGRGGVRHLAASCSRRVAGAILPGGPFTIYPVAAAFLAAGADAGAACAFVISWTLLGYTRAIVWELPFFGLDFVTWRIIFSLPLPILAGLAARVCWRLRASAWRARMNLIIDIVLWAIVVALGAHGLPAQPAAVRRTRCASARSDFLALLPRIAIGMIGSGFIAEILPSS